MQRNNAKLHIKDTTNSDMNWNGKGVNALTLQQQFYKSREINK